MLGRELAKRAGIAPNYLSKILWTLGTAGLIDATRGSSGGYRLRKNPEEIHLIEVVKLFEKSQQWAACFLGGGRECSDSSPCSAHETWNQVGKAYMCFLESTTIAQISDHSPAPPDGASPDA
jgi:Rrf2 family nitric oxide-sensitive transcriptional repressor